MYLFFILAVIPLSSSLHAAGRNESLNKFLDALIFNVKNTKELPLNPLPLANTTENIDKSSWIYYLYNNYTLYNGTVYNLTTVDRYGDSFISYNNDNNDENNLKINVGLTFERIEVNYIFEITGHYNLMSQRGLITAIIKDFKVMLEVDANTMSYKAHVDGSFPDPGPLTVKLEASSILKYIINGILDIGTTWFEDSIMNAVKESVLKVINDMLMKNMFSN